MTAFASTSSSFSVHSKDHIPAPLDQPTPQSPPSPSSSFMSSHVPSTSMTTKKFTHQSLPNVATPPNGPRQPVISTTSLLTPGSCGAPNSAHSDMDVDEESFGDGNPNKRRRTYGSFDAERRSMPPNLRHDGNSTDDRSVASPSMLQIQELINNPDCSPYHLVCEKPHEKAYPDPTENLIQVYGLQPIADKVARFDATGKKNKLRKSYKGHIATLSGKNDVVAKPTQLGEYYDASTLDPVEQKLQYLACYPDDDWNAQHVIGKEIGRGFDMSKLGRGLMGITKGDIPGFDPSVLGLDDELPRKRLENARSPPLAIGTPQVNGSTPGNASTISVGANGDDRPHRKNKRRRYDEGSYEGYEGYEDDDAGTSAGNGPSGGGGGGGSWQGDQAKQKKKKRKKNPDVGSPGMDLARHSVPVQSSMIYGR